MSLSYFQLDLDERRRIDRMHNRQISVADIAAAVGRHRSTIYRELRRNRSVDHEMPELDGYYCLSAQDKAQDRSQRQCNLIRHSELHDAVVDRLKVGWSPERIAGRLRRECSSLQICHETIYRYVYCKDTSLRQGALHSGDI